MRAAVCAPRVRVAGLVLTALPVAECGPPRAGRPALLQDRDRNPLSLRQQIIYFA
jgi:hypothetical protein